MPDDFTSGDGRMPNATIVAGTTGNSAALLLVESLIHGLIARSILSLQEAIDIVEIAADVERQIDDDRAEPTANFQSVLIPIADSLRVDLAG